jgi:hypothetical protein
MLTDALDCYLKDFCESGRDLSLSEGAKVVFSYSEIVFGLESKKSAEPLKRLDIMIHKLCPYMLSLSPKQRREVSVNGFREFENISEIVQLVQLIPQTPCRA